MMKSLFTLYMAFFAFSHVHAAAPPKVVVSIAPVHALVENIVKGTGVAPALLLPAYQTPHQFALKPSQAKLLSQADMVIFVSPELEIFLQKSIQSLAGKNTRIVSLDTLPGLVLHSNRFNHNHQAAHHHEHGQMDPHLWLDPHNAMRIVEYVSTELTRMDPLHAELYRANTKKEIAKLRELDQEIRNILTKAQNNKKKSKKEYIPYFTYHNAYQYFEKRYALEPSTALTMQPESGVNAKTALEAQIQTRQAPLRCIFSEPQFDSAIVKKLAAQTGASIRILNPEGVKYNGPDPYLAMMREITKNFSECIEP